MEAEAQKLMTQENVYQHNQIQFKASDQDIQVAAAFSSTRVTTGGGNDHGVSNQFKVSAASSCNKITIEGENDGISNQHEKEKNLLPARDHPVVSFNSSNSFLYTQDGPIGITISPSEGVQEIYLTKMFFRLPNHAFYCPNCKVCIEKVLFYKTDENPPVPAEPPVIDGPVRCSACLSLLIQKGKEFFTGLVSHGSSDPSGPTPAPRGRPESTKEWEVLKSIVYGGLAELLASLSVVTSAASADATTLNIVALGIANLIGGLFVLGHNLRDLKASQPREEGSEIEAEGDKYYELLGKRENSILHAFVAILSFLIFGLVPPAVYAFSFRESDDKDLKLAAVAGASLLCIALLGIAKAYIQRPNNYVTYIKTVLYYVTSGVLASLLTYVAGSLVKKLVEQLGWFEPKSGLSVPEISVEKHEWGSY
ncbi:uncharacterized protein LOC133292394 [Gastrolobium bilobum]|uniref:uncharacterized protein LOC133292394 n=1 Tax=Gastrolobium bilobum TaxID=150636 RepID=UPI002AB2A611|nr:uncharacterized protein LOC133292394 [Gastrolobium bilobum]